MDQPLVIFLGACAIGSVLVALPGLFAGRQNLGETRIARRVMWQFFAVIGLPVLGVLLIILSFFSFLTTLDPRIWQALVAGLFIATGWVTTAVFSEISAQRSKAERLRDFHKALYAEIGHTLQSLWDEGQSKAHADGILERMHADPEFVPFIPREQNAVIFNTLLGQIDVLPRQTLDQIVSYYSVVKSLEALGDDMRGASFRRLPQDRRIPMYEDYLAMRREAFEFGQYALRLMGAYAEGGAAAAEAERANILAEGRSVPSRGRE